MFHVMHWFSCNGFIVRKFHPMILAFHRHPRSRPRFFKHLCNPIMYLPWYPHTKCSPPIMVGLSECSFLSAVSNSDATEYCNGYVSMKIGVWSLVFGILPRWVAKVPGPQEPKSHRLWAEKTDNAFQFVKFCSKPLKDFLYTFVSGDGEVWCQDMSRKAAPPRFSSTFGQRNSAGGFGIGTHLIALRFNAAAAGLVWSLSANRSQINTCYTATLVEMLQALGLQIPSGRRNQKNAKQKQDIDSWHLWVQIIMLHSRECQFWEYCVKRIYGKKRNPSRTFTKLIPTSHDQWMTMIVNEKTMLKSCDLRKLLAFFWDRKSCDSLKNNL